MRVRFSIEEGTPCLTPVDEAIRDEWSEGMGPDFEFLEMPAIECVLRWATDCPAYDTDDNCIPTGPTQPMGGFESGSHYIVHGRRCDCNWWPVVVPLPSAPAAKVEACGWFQQFLGPDADGVPWNGDTCGSCGHLVGKHDGKGRCGECRSERT